MIACGDLHIRSNPPRCWGGTEEQWYEYTCKVLEFIFSQKDDIYIAGDIFHKSVIGIRFFNAFLYYALNRKYHTYIMPGNHDLIANDLSTTDSTHFGTLLQISQHPNSVIHLIHDKYSALPFGTDEVMNPEKEILFVHRLVVDSEKDVPPGSDAKTAREMLKEHIDYPLILCSDNHKFFRLDKGERTLVNIGCVMVQDASYKNADLRIIRVDSEYGVEELSVPKMDNFVDDAYLVAQHEREEKIGAFVESLKDADGEINLDFHEALRHKIGSLEPGVQRMLHKIIPELEDENEAV